MASTATIIQSSAPLAAASPLASATDCEKVNIVLDQLIEGRSLSEADEDLLISYGEDCSPCFETLERQQAFVGFLKQKVDRYAAPAMLSHSIMARLHAEVA